MTAKAIFCCLIAFVTLGHVIGWGSNKGDPIRWESLKVKFTLGFDGLFNIPLNIATIKNNEFVYLDNHQQFTSAKIYCYPNDPRLCPIYDSHKNIAGLRVAYIKDDLKIRGGESPYSFNKPIFGEGTAYGYRFYYIDVLFIHPKSLENGGPVNRDEAVGSGVYLRIDEGQWSEMPRLETDVMKTPFTKQACFPGMGMHYFYNMKPELDCKDHQPPFLLYDRGHLVGLGLIPFGSFTSSGTRTWFEDPPASVVKVIAPKSPPCFKEWINKYGSTSLHIFFKKCTRLTCVPLLGRLFSKW